MYVQKKKNKKKKNKRNKTGCPRSGKKSGKKYFVKVRELSGNFEICQGILEFKQKSGKGQGNLK